MCPGGFSPPPMGLGRFYFKNSFDLFYSNCSVSLSDYATPSFEEYSILPITLIFTSQFFYLFIKIAFK